MSNSLSSGHLGLLILATALAVYLGSVPPHTQMVLVQEHLQQLLEERGVVVQWEMPHTLALYNYSTPEEGNSDHTHCHTYSQFSACMLPFLCDKLTLVKWVTMGYNLSQLVQATLLLLSWKYWPLAFDRDHVALQMLRDHVGDSLVVLDWSSRTPPLLQRLEHALTAGEPVLVENVGPALDPALQPVMLLARTRNSSTSKRNKILKGKSHDLVRRSCDLVGKVM